MATKTVSTVQPPLVHAKTGLPIQRVATFAVGDLVTRSIGSDSYPAVVVKITSKAIWVRSVSFVVGNATEHSAANYLDDTTLVIDPESVENALALGVSTDEYGMGGAQKYVLKVSSQADTGASHREREQVGAQVFHRAKWGLPNAYYGSVSPGARYRQDPHF